MERLAPAATKSRSGSPRRCRTQPIHPRASRSASCGQAHIGVLGVDRRHLIDAVHELAYDKQSQRQRDQLVSVRELRQPERKTLGAGLEVLANCGKQQSQSRQDDPTMAALVPEACTCARQISATTVHFSRVYRSSRPIRAPGMKKLARETLTTCKPCFGTLQPKRNA